MVLSFIEWQPLEDLAFMRAHQETTVSGFGFPEEKQFEELKSRFIIIIIIVIVVVVITNRKME